MVADPQLDREKLKAAVLHIIGTCPADKLGQVKLHKVLYYSDMLSYIHKGESITGAAYRKRPFGPTCDALLFVLDELQIDGFIRSYDVEYFGYRKRQFESLKAANSNRLSDHEMLILDEIVAFVCEGNSAKTISEFSHAAAWDMVELGEVIPYFTAIQWIPAEPSKEALEWADKSLVEIADDRLHAANRDMADNRTSAIRARMVELSQQRSGQV